MLVPKRSAQIEATSSAPITRFVWSSSKQRSLKGRELARGSLVGIEGDDESELNVSAHRPWTSLLEARTLGMTVSMTFLNFATLYHLKLTRSDSNPINLESRFLGRKYLFVGLLRNKQLIPKQPFVSKQCDCFGKTKMIHIG
jgi:hypothetical protein